eukprot:3938041-Rhodomonas_salina.2
MRCTDGACGTMRCTVLTVCMILRGRRLWTRYTRKTLPSSWFSIGLYPPTPPIPLLQYWRTVSPYPADTPHTLLAFHIPLCRRYPSYSSLGPPTLLLAVFDYAPTHLVLTSCIVLCPCYEISGTDTAFRGTRPPALVVQSLDVVSVLLGKPTGWENAKYAPPMRSPVSPFALATRCPVPTRSRTYGVSVSSYAAAMRCPETSAGGPGQVQNDALDFRSGAILP